MTAHALPNRRTLAYCVIRLKNLGRTNPTLPYECGEKLATK